MWPFNRQESVEDSDLPEEVKEYYEAERREHIGVAWLLAFVTLVATVAVIFVLFAGGRWVYHKYVHKNTTKTTQTATTAQPKSQPTDSAKSPIATTQPNPSKPTVSPAPAGTTPTITTPSTPAPTPAPAATLTPAATPPPKTSTNSTQSTSQNLTNTGPGDTVAIFIGVTAVATLGHLVYSRRKLAKETSVISNT